MKLLGRRLFVFVTDYRLTKDEAAKTAVGAAVRKLASNLQQAQIEQYSELFLPSDTDTLPCEIELELAKSILWRLSTLPATLCYTFSNLETRLSELALDYLKPRLILQKNYASVALHAALGVLLLNGKHADSVAESINNLGIAWFTDLFRRRLERLCKQVSESGYRDAKTVATLLKRFSPQSQEK